MLFLLLLLHLTYFSVEAVNWQLVWADEFNGHNISMCDWHFDIGTGPGGWGNNEREFYTSRHENVRVENGHLVIQAKPENYASQQFTSARILSQRAWTFGKFEIRAKLPKGKNLWPALWMMPENFDYGFWAASGEIDIVELRGEREHQIQGTIHYGGTWPNNIYTGSGETNFPVDFSADFHTFAIEWEAHEIRWYLDGKEYHKENLNRIMWSGKGTNPYNKNGQPFDRPFFIILCVAVSGNFFPTNVYGNAVTFQEAQQWPKNTMEIDYVRVYRQS